LRRTERQSSNEFYDETESRDPMRSINMVRQETRNGDPCFTARASSSSSVRDNEAPDNQEPWPSPVDSSPHHERHWFEGQEQCSNGQICASHVRERRSTAKRHTKQFLKPHRGLVDPISVHSKIHRPPHLRGRDAAEAYRAASRTNGTKTSRPSEPYISSR
jgi:hypothetical protein